MERALHFFLESFLKAVNISIFVFMMMVLIDWLQVRTQGKLEHLLGKNLWRQYALTSFLGATPGCLGAFLVVSLYIRQLVSFGALTGTMIATSGDEAFVMLSQFPLTALVLFGLLFISGIIFARIADAIFRWQKLKPCPECELAELHSEEVCQTFDSEVWRNFPRWSLLRYLFFFITLALFLLSIFQIIGEPGWGWERISLLVLLAFGLFLFLTCPEHYLREHIFEHILKKHIWKVFLWTFFALLLVEVALGRFNLEQYIRTHLAYVLLISALLGIIPESGPHLVFVFLYTNGVIPFSILFTSSFVQDGHGMLPLLSYTIRDSLLIKLLNLIFGLLVGGILYLCGL